MNIAIVIVGFCLQSLVPTACTRALGRWGSHSRDLPQRKMRRESFLPGRGTPLFEGQCAGMILQSAISAEIGNGEPCGNKNARDIDLLETMKVPKADQKFRLVLQKCVISITQQKCIYTNAHRIAKKARGAGSCCAAGKYSCHHRNMVIDSPLECCRGY